MNFRLKELEAQIDKAQKFFEDVSIAKEKKEAHIERFRIILAEYSPLWEADRQGQLILNGL